MEKSTAKTLVVDNDPIQIEHLEKCLHKIGFEIYSATKSDEAVKIAYQIIPDLILLDIMMPEKDGYTIMVPIETCLLKQQMMPSIWRKVEAETAGGCGKGISRNHS